MQSTQWKRAPIGSLPCLPRTDIPVLWHPESPSSLHADARSPSFTQALVNMEQVLYLPENVREWNLYLYILLGA